MKPTITSLLLLLKFVNISQGCNGFDIHTTYIRNCEKNDDQIFIIFPNSSIRVNNKCELISDVCNDVKPFHTVSSSLVVAKGVETIFNRTLNVCEYRGKSNEMSKAIHAIYGFRGCNMKPGQFCEKGSKILTFNSFQRTFNLLGGGDKLKITGRVTFDTGSACIEAEAVIRKKERKN